MKIGIAADHAGYKMKQYLIGVLKELGHEIRDFGTNSDESTDYPDYAHPLASAVENGELEFGFALCGSGNGINITVNKHQGIRAALCWKVEIARLARSHNNANICSIPALFVSEAEAKEIAQTFLSTPFEGGRHQRRIDKIPCS